MSHFKKSMSIVSSIDLYNVFNISISETTSIYYNSTYINMSRIIPTV